ncbi:unnamed protein product, partial [Protopolystoma xenopodis]
VYNATQLRPQLGAIVSRTSVNLLCQKEAARQTAAHRYFIQLWQRRCAVLAQAGRHFADQVTQLTQGLLLRLDSLVCIRDVEEPGCRANFSRHAFAAGKQTWPNADLTIFTCLLNSSIRELAPSTLRRTPTLMPTRRVVKAPSFIASPAPTVVRMKGSATTEGQANMFITESLVIPGSSLNDGDESVGSSGSATNRDGARRNCGGKQSSSGTDKTTLAQGGNLIESASSSFREPAKSASSPSLVDVETSTCGLVTAKTSEAHLETIRARDVAIKASDTRCAVLSVGPWTWCNLRRFAGIAIFSSEANSSANFQAISPHSVLAHLLT